MAIIGIVGAIGATNGRQIAQREAAHGSLATVQQSIWQGATAAASRGRVVELILDDDELRLVFDGGGVHRTFELPESASLNVENGTLLRFTPPGKVDLATLRALPEDLVIDTGERRYRLDISLIGEVVATPLTGDG